MSCWLSREKNPGAVKLNCGGPTACGTLQPFENLQTLAPIRPPSESSSFPQKPVVTEASLRAAYCALFLASANFREPEAAQTGYYYRSKNVNKEGIIMRSDISNGIGAALLGGMVFGIMMQMMTAPTPDGGQMR